jgi:hypothetical protein
MQLQLRSTRFTEPCSLKTARHWDNQTEVRKPLANSKRLFLTVVAFTSTYIELSNYSPINSVITFQNK